MAMNVGGDRKGEINITPLIDVVLVLLIIFMVLVPSTIKQLTATVPRKEQAAAQLDVPRQIVLTIGAGGDLSLGDEVIRASDLRQVMQARLSQAGGKVVFFDIHDDAPYGAVVRVMDVVKGAGAQTLAIVTRD